MSRRTMSGRTMSRAARTLARAAARAAMGAACLVLLSAGAFAQETRYYAEGGRQVKELRGTIPGPTARLRIESDRGTVHLRRNDGDQVAYKVRLNVIAANPNEARKRLDRMVISASRADKLVEFTGTLPHNGPQGINADFEISVPDQVTTVEVVTGAGDIEAVGPKGSVSLLTRGGGIVAHDIAGPLVAETRGGNVRTGLLGSSARLVSAGGNVVVESVAGDLSVRTSGGDVRIDRSDGEVRIESGGGNVRVGKVRRGVSVSTNGGDIDVAESGGQVAAASAGGGIRVGSAASGVQCETAAGPIVLKDILGPIRALTSAGSIHALLVGSKLPGDWDLQALQGDIVVSLPESLPVTIRALIDNPQGKGIESEFPMKILRDLEETGRPLLIGEGQVGGGGGPMLKIRTLSGRIQILKAKSTIPNEEERR